MMNIFVGLIFVFFKTNLNFLDVGVTYYVTNIIGYISIYFGINELGKVNQKLLKIKPYVIIMIAHSLIFFLLNLTGYSPLKIALSTTLEVTVALVGVVFIIVGMFLVFVIIPLILENLISDTKKELLESLINIMMLLFILSGISAYFNYIPMLATGFMGVLLLLEGFFLIGYYNAFLSKDEKYT